MKRLAPLALTPLLALAAPAIAQPTADMSLQAKRYGPQETPIERLRPLPRDRAYSLGEIVPLPPPPDRDRMIAAQPVAPDARLGIGFFRIITPDNPLAVNREAIVESQIAAVGLAVKFRR